MRRLMRQALRVVGLAYYEMFLGPRGYGCPVPANTWDSQYRTGHWDNFESLDELPRYALIAAYIRNHPAPPAILDVGCGYGRLLTELEGFPLREYVGIDLSTEGVSKARACVRARVAFEVADFTEWRPPSRFDIVVFNESLYYASRPIQVLSRYFDALEEDGLVIVSMFRHRNTKIIWKNIARHFLTIGAVEVKNGKGELTDIRVLKRPRHQRGAGAGGDTADSGLAHRRLVGSGPPGPASAGPQANAGAAREAAG